MTLTKNNLKNYRTEKGISQEKLADIVDVSRQTIISIEKGKYTPSLELALKLAKVFGVNVEQLFDIEGDYRWK